MPIRRAMPLASFMTSTASGGARRQRDCVSSVRPKCGTISVEGGMPVDSFRGLRALLVVHGFMTLAAGIVLAAAPGFIPHIVGIDL